MWSSLLQSLLITLKLLTVVIKPISSMVADTVRFIFEYGLK